MSQSKVKDFFTSRKGIRDLQPSKRRKLDQAQTQASSDGDGSESEVVSKYQQQPRMDKIEAQLSTKNEDKSYVNSDSIDAPKSIMSVTLSASKPSKTGARSHATRSRPVTVRGRKSKSILPAKGQQTLDFKAGTGKAIADDRKELEVDTNFNKSATSLENDIGTVTEAEEVTSVRDDHIMNQECTPRKRIMTEMDSLSQGPKARVKKTAARKLNQGDQSDSPSPSLQHEVKKKLELDEVNNPKSAETKIDGSSSKAEILSLVTEMSGVQSAISPLALTPEHVKSSIPTPTTMTPKLHNLSEKLKVLSKMDGQALKNRLKKKGMLGEVREKVQELSKASSDKRATAPAEPVTEEKSEAKLPAYQRFDHLVKEGPPTLILPYTYRLLENAFQAMDTVVSMLHNRSEVCTFNKLQASVQNITKKNFPEKTAGQIKAVAPDAYTFKQEKIPVYGQRTCPYVLTVEANLNNNDSGVKKNTAKDRKIPFTASLLLRRKTLFKASLLKIVKKHHRTFLESLTPPMRIPDDKLSRWHPKFALDRVPVILPSDLPQPPNLQVCRSAKDVLEMQVGKLNPRIQKALSKVAAETCDANKSSSLKQDNTSKANTKETCKSQTNVSSTPTPSPQSSPTQSSMKGIPPALLAKIRAKEALKMEQALTRDPAEERKIKMLGHLPEIIRILRSYFVTEKRPALPLESVMKKLGDSYHTGMSQGDIEQHIKLLKETAPEFLSIVEIQRGKFVKLDKNVDISALSNRINNIVKASK